MDIPLSISQVLGFTHSERINTLTVDIITQSAGRDAILQSPACRDAMGELRAFMFEFVYRNPVAKGEEGKVRSCSAAVRLLPAGAGPSYHRSFRTSGWRRAWSGPSATILRA